jgi:biopolymer transport protein ExbD
MAAKLSGGSGDGSRYTTQQNSDINVTPFVDIMLVLLIIFMVSVPVATVSIKLDLPPAVGNPEDKKPKDPVFISIQDTGSYFIAERKTSLQTLIADLNYALKSDNPRDERVLVRAQADVKYEEFMKVLNELHSNGYYKIGLINEDIE